MKQFIKLFVTMIILAVTLVFLHIIANNIWWGMVRGRFEEDFLKHSIVIITDDGAVADWVAAGEVIMKLSPTREGVSFDGQAR